MLHPKSLVLINGLTKASQYNGMNGHVVKFLEDKSRYQIILRKSKKILAIRPDNLTLVEQTCRFCFNDEPVSDLISPCMCSGTSKFIHQKCLHAWQRALILQQSNHPLFYEKDPRIQTCSVCKTRFTCPLLTRNFSIEFEMIL